MSDSPLNLLNDLYCACNSVFSPDFRPQAGCTLAHFLVCHCFLDSTRKSFS
jgi:hypothetical protein